MVAAVHNLRVGDLSGLLQKLSNFSGKMKEIGDMKIQMRFALDHNNNKRIEKEEVVKFQDLKALDANQNNSLDGRELNDVYFEYGDDEWLSGGRTHYRESDGYSQRIRLEQVNFDPAGIKMKIDMSM